MTAPFGLLMYKSQRQLSARINAQILRRLPSTYAMIILTALTIAKKGGSSNRINDAHIAVAGICPHQHLNLTTATAFYPGNDNTNWL